MTRIMVDARLMKTVLARGLKEMAAPAGHPRQYRGRATVMFSVEDGMREFLTTPCQRPVGMGGGGWTNQDVIVHAMGVRGVDVVDAASFDAATLTYERACKTFRDAFRACARSYDRSGHRDWRDLDIETLRACRPEFAVLALPEWLVEMQDKVEMEELADHLSAAGDDADDEHDNSDAIPF